VQELARQANRNLPELRTHDRWGRRIDQIEFHPAWHELMTLAMRDEFHSLCWTKPKPGAQVARAAVSFLWNQGENGVCCPLGMTYSAIPILRRDPARWAEFGKLVMSTDYDGRPLPAAQKRGGTVGMAMTEKQGGSDLRQTQTTATKNSDGTYSLVGHKWFFSVPHSDVFLTLARTEEGVSCFVVAGWLPDGLLIRHAPHDITDAFIASRLAGPWSGHFGTLPRGANAQAIARRVAPQLM
jgi:putative acyl-CoA dehydrogenase